MSFVWMKKSKDIKVQFMRYAVVGGIAFIADYSSLFIFTEIFKLHYLLSAAFGFLIGLVINYFLSIKWVFDQPKSNKIFKFSIFAVIGIVGLGLNELIIWFLTEEALLHYLVSKIAATIIVLCWNFLARRKLMMGK